MHTAAYEIFTDLRAVLLAMHLLSERYEEMIYLRLNRRNMEMLRASSIHGDARIDMQNVLDYLETELQTPGLLRELVFGAPGWKRGVKPSLKDRERAMLHLFDESREAEKMGILQPVPLHI